jgi:4-carboxymuconolactone decarboxylase
MAKKAKTKSKPKPKIKTLIPRLPQIPEDELTEPQRNLMESIRSGPRGRVSQGGPFGVYLYATEFGSIAQQLGAHCRYNKVVPPRLSEFVILCTARYWRANYEWYAHAIHAEKAGVTPATIADIKAGRKPKKAPKDELALYDYFQEYYKTRRVSDRTYQRVHAFLGDQGMVELAGIMGYYVMVSNLLNMFNVPVPPDAKPAFAEK